MKKIFLFVSIISLFSVGDAQTLKLPAPSPTQTLDQAFALSNIKIEYSRPSMKGRTVFGDLVPFGKIWRTGANAATKITFGDSVGLEGKPVPAGTYALYTIPGADSWEILIYKDLTLGGNVSDYKTENELVRFTVKPEAYASKTETFTIQVNNIMPASCVIELIWDQTRVAIKVSTEIDSRIMKNIEGSVIKDSRPYFQAANYYYENNKDLVTALDWVNKAVESNPKAFWISHLKAKILLKMKNYKAAIEAAEKSMAVAKDSKADDYVKMNEKLIAEAKAGGK